MIDTPRHGTAHDAITDATAALHDLVQQQLAILERRATALASNAAFDRALCDATQMKHIAPFSPAGYLCASRIRAMQGRQLAAMEECVQGIHAAATASCDPLYAQLHSTKATAASRQAARIDFIAELPLDVIDNIAARFFPQVIRSCEAATPYLGVSRTWRERLCACTELELALTAFNPSVDHALVSCAPFVRRLSLSSGGLQYFHLLPTCTMVQSLAVTYHSLLDGDLVLEALGHVGSRLRKLSIECADDGPATLSIGVILGLCPNLSSLHCHGISMDMAAAGADKCPKMTSLSLAHTYPLVNGAMLEHMVSLFPALRVFAIDRLTDPCALLLVQAHCPMLKALLHDTPLSAVPKFHVSLHQNHATGASLQTLCVNGSHLSTHDLFTLLEQSKDTLQELRYWHRATVAAPALVQSRQLRRRLNLMGDSVTIACQFNHMSTFLCELEDRRSQSIAARVIQNAPSLQHVALKNSLADTAWSDAIFDALTALPKLHTLELAMRRIDDRALQRFANRHGGGGARAASLRHLSLGAFYGLQDETLYRVACILSLESISVDSRAVEKVSSLVTWMQHLGQGCPRLRQVRFAGTTAASDPILCQLHHMPHLERLLLSNLPYISDAGVMALLACPRLAHVRVDGCARISEAALDALQRKAGITTVHTK